MKRNVTHLRTCLTLLRRNLLGGLVVLALTAPAPADVAEHKIDIVPSEPGTGDSIDPKNVAVISDGAHLTLVFDTGQDIRAYLMSNQASSLAELWIDTDGDETTGGKPFFSDIGGFEYAANRVYVCKGFGEDGSSGHVCAGDMEGVEFTAFFSSYSSQLWDPSIADYKDIHEPFWDGGRHDIDGQKVTVIIPYAEFKGVPGQTLRLLILAGSFDGSKFPEVQLELK